MRFTTVHINALSALVLQALLTLALIAGLYVLIIHVNGKIDETLGNVLTGAMLPIIGQSIHGLSTTARRFTYIKPGSEEDGE